MPSYLLLRTLRGAVTQGHASGYVTQRKVPLRGTDSPVSHALLVVCEICGHCRETE